MQDTHEEVKKHLINIFNKKENRLPEWRLLVDVARKVKYETNFDNATFATRVYYAMKDLLQPVKNRWHEITEVNKKNKTVTAITYEMPKNGIEKKIDETTWTPKEAFWDSLYKNKPLDFFNKGRRPDSIPKLSIYLINGPNENVVENWINKKKIEEELDKLFKPIIDTDIPAMTFEDVIKEFKTEEVYTDPLDFVLQNNFDHVDPNEVYNHFKALVSKKYLSEKELRAYLKKAFELMELPEKRLSFTGLNSKSSIYKIFHSYYKDKASHPSKKQLKYVCLLSNYFEGFNQDTVKTNWTKY